MTRTRHLAATGVLAALVLVGGGTYALGHASGVAAGKKSGGAEALQGVTPADMALIRQLEADRVVAAQHPPVVVPVTSPTAAASDDGCGHQGGDVMVKSSACTTGVHGTGTNSGAPVAVADVAAAVPAATAYLAWLTAHPQPNEPLLLSRLLAARVALPAGAVASDITGGAADDANGQVQVTMGDALACVDVLDARVDPGKCYGGAGQNSHDGYDGPKPFPPNYQAAE